MSAKEMFEKLKYKLDDQGYALIYWKVAPRQRINANFYQNEIQIEINSAYKTVEKRELFKTDENANVITFKELQAINKQVEELGWIGSDKE